MYVELPQELIQYAGGGFLLGCLLTWIASRLRARRRAGQRDPRDVRIRELEAELRIAKGEAERSKSSVERLEEELKETTISLECRDTVISQQQAKLKKVTADLKDSVVKTRELRAELAERATQNVQAEAKIREVETELSVAQASTDMIATGVLDYSLAPDKEDSWLSDEHNSDGFTKTAT